MTASELERKGVKVRWLHERLRTLIESEQWPDGYQVPSQAVLAEQYGMSMRTVRDAVTLLVEDGLAIRNQGMRTRVYQPEPPHQIVVHQRLESNSRVTDPNRRVVSFLQGLGTGPLWRFWDVGTVRMTGRDGRRLGLEACATVLRRALTVSIGGQPVLASNSFLSIDLTNAAAVTGVARDAGSWQEAEIGDLALSGLPVTSGPVTVYSRAPTFAEAKALAIVRGIPVFVFSRPYWVFPGADVTRSRPAGVLVVARSDRVFWAP
jgi:GntR family transcriptional regulator